MLSRLSKNGYRVAEKYKLICTLIGERVFSSVVSEQIKLAFCSNCPVRPVRIWSMEPVDFELDRKLLWLLREDQGHDCRRNH